MEVHEALGVKHRAAVNQPYPPGRLAKARTQPEPGQEVLCPLLEMYGHHAKNGCAPVSASPVRSPTLALQATERLCRGRPHLGPPLGYGHGSLPFRPLCLFVGQATSGEDLPGSGLLPVLTPN